MMQLTRQQIIDHLQVNRLATSIELSRALMVTAANIRHHLRLLDDDGLVEVVGQEPVRGRGRPMKIYALTENALQRNFDGLASALLKALPADKSDSNAVLAQVAAYLLGEYQPDAKVHIRLNQAVERLNQLKYHAAWEAAVNGPRIIFRNCPYAMILPEHPELCQLDAELLKQMLHQPVEQTAKLERSPDGSPYCLFVASNPK
jgi:predicted ArsR family transcriptional regulator